MSTLLSVAPASAVSGYPNRPDRKRLTTTDVLDTTQDMLKANCTTVSFAEDKSNYWQPALYYINPDGTYTLVPPYNIVIYYTSLFQNSVPFPEGMRMIIGNAMKRDQGAERFQGIRLSGSRRPSGERSSRSSPRRRPRMT